jgi:hypothetical protein
LGADIQFLHTVMGIQTCSARYCCAKCLVTLKDLREELSFECFPARTIHSFNQALVNVHEGATWDDKRRLAHTNESVMREPLNPIDFSRVMLAALHVIIGITMSLYMNLVSDIQEVESEYLAERRMLSEACDNLTLYIAKGQKEREKVKQHLKNVEEKRANFYNLKEALRKQLSPAASKEELALANEDLINARSEKKVLEEKFKAFNAVARNRLTQCIACRRC